MRGSTRARRLDADEPLSGAYRAPKRPPASVAARAGAFGDLDLGSRIGLAADLQGTAGNAATAQLVGFTRTDRQQQPPAGLRALMDASGPGNRGLTRTSYGADAPLFRIRRTEQVGETWHVKPGDVRLDPPDHEVWWPAAGRHRIGDYGRGSQILEVTEEWSNRIKTGEDEHVADSDLAWEMIRGRVASVINEMAAGDDYTGSTVDEAQAAAWREFKRRLPAPMRPEGDQPSNEAQEAKWGQDPRTTIFRQMMRVTRQARDLSGWHTPEESMHAMEGENRIDRLAEGNSRIPGTASPQLMQEAWDRITGSS
jgi:hypothetical protein